MSLILCFNCGVEVERMISLKIGSEFSTIFLYSWLNALRADVSSINCKRAFTGSFSERVLPLIYASNFSLNVGFKSCNASIKDKLARIEMPTFTWSKITLRFSIPNNSRDLVFCK